MFKVPFVRLSPTAKAPIRGTEGAAAFDLTADIASPMVLRSGEVVRVPTGLGLELPPSFAALVLPRSGLSLKGLMIANAPGLIDSDFRGEIKVALRYIAGPQDPESILIVPEQRIAQLLVIAYAPIYFVEQVSLTPTSRGAGGWGSTDV